MYIFQKFKYLINDDNNEKKKKRKEKENSQTRHTKFLDLKYNKTIYKVLIFPLKGISTTTRERENK